MNCYLIIIILFYKIYLLMLSLIHCVVYVFVYQSYLIYIQFTLNLLGNPNPLNNSLPVYRQYSLISYHWTDVSYPQFSNSYTQSYPQVILVMNTWLNDNVNVVITKLNGCNYWHIRKGISFKHQTRQHIKHQHIRNFYNLFFMSYFYHWYGISIALRS